MEHLSANKRQRNQFTSDRKPNTVHNHSLPDSENEATGKFVWILIQGCTQINIESVKVSKKRGSKHDNSLISMALDTANMEFFINRERKHHYFYAGISSNKETSTQSVLNEITETCKYAKLHRAKGVQIYYTGHSEVNTGNWVFNNGVIALQQIIDIVLTHWSDQDFDIFCDCDYAGNWAKELYKYTKQGHPKMRLVSVHAACWPGKLALDSLANGGYFTLVISGRKADHQLDKLNRCEANLDINHRYSMTYWTPNGPRRMRPVVKKQQTNAK